MNGNVKLPVDDPRKTPPPHEDPDDNEEPIREPPKNKRLLKEPPRRRESNAQVDIPVAIT